MYKLTSALVLLACFPECATALHTRSGMGNNLHSGIHSCIDRSVVVGSIVKDMERTVSPGVQEMVKVASLFCKHHIVVFENDSKDHTADAVRRAFEDVKPITQNVSLYSSHLEHPRHTTRTGKIAQARNQLIDRITHQFDSFDFIILMDIDMGADDHWINSPQFWPKQKFSRCSVNTTVIQQAMQLSSQWDALSFRVEPYWDIWALRADFAPSNVWGGGVQLGGPVGTKTVKTYKAAVESQLSTLRDDEFLPVVSAFMLLEIIKRPMAVNVTYSGEFSGEMDCEHVGFHQQMQERHQARIRISPMRLCLAEELGGKAHSKRNVVRNGDQERLAQAAHELGEQLTNSWVEIEEDKAEQQGRYRSDQDIKDCLVHGPLRQCMI